MLRRIWISFRRDNLINLRNGYYLVNIAVAVIYLVVIRWLIPAEMNLEPDIYLLDRTGDASYTMMVAQSDLAGNVTLVADDAELEQAMLANPNSIGIALVDSATLGGGADMPDATLYFQMSHNERVRNLLAVAIEGQLRAMYGVPQAAPIALSEQVLRGRDAQTIPFNMTWVPILLFSDAAMIAVVFVAALVFMEKEEGTLRAYMVSPGRVWEYLLSKALSLGVLAALFGLILVPLTVGRGPNYLHLLALMAMGAMFSALLGATVASFFDNFSQYLFPSVALMVGMTLPSVSYFVPSFSPAWLRLIPTYPLAFGLREAIFPTGNPQIVGNAMLALLVLNLVLLAIGSVIFDRQVARS